MLQIMPCSSDTLKNQPTLEFSNDIPITLRDVISLLNMRIFNYLYIFCLSFFSFYITQYKKTMGGGNLNIWHVGSVKVGEVLLENKQICIYQGRLKSGQ